MPVRIVNVITRMIVGGGRGNPMGVGELERVDHAEDLVEVPARGLRVEDSCPET
jgi:hypothetical protein